jgi:dienelactone hydrolase
VTVIRRLSPVFLLLVPTTARPQSVYPPPADVKAAFLKLLDRPKTPLDAKVIDVKPIGGRLIAERLDFATEKHADGKFERVPTLIVRPATAASRRPAVIVLHGTGGNKESLHGWLNELARAGMIGVAIDARFHGQRSGGARRADAYVQAITEAWRSPPGEEQKHPFYYDTCWDLWRTIDYLQTRDDVDPDRIGMVGISMGGIETWLAAAVDDRVRVAAPAIAVQSFRWSLEHDQWQGRARTIAAVHDAAAADLGKKKVDADVCRALWNKVIPGMLGQFDCPSMIRLFAGRELIIVNGEKDQNCPIEGAGVAFDSARDAFKDAGRADHLKIIVAPGVGHAVTGAQHAAIMKGLVEWLKPDV